MSYEKKTWETGEVITANGLNHIEQGLADCYGDGGRFDVNVTMGWQTDHIEVTGYDKTVEEMVDAYNDGKCVVAHVVLNNAHHIFQLEKCDEGFVAFSGVELVGNQAGIYYMELSNIGQPYFNVKVI